MSQSSRRPTAPCLMIQGTGSSVGKSFVVAGICRYLTRQGLRVAPYKSQNMSLNSAVCQEGTEISRAQAMQAEAAKTAATKDMNPILLKPTADKKAQLLVKGKIVGNYTASEYHNMKLSLLKHCTDSLNNLRSEYQAIIIEGAGSPAEINLIEQDIANMKIAHAADCPVLIVADIDKGGVFASIYGTYELLPDKDRQRIAGFIINKFRGDKSLLDEGIDFIQQKTDLPVLGVLPYQEIELDAEDSAINLPSNHGEINIAVIKLPRLSNFTDFWALQKEKDIGLRYVTKAKDIAEADIIVIPGSKSVISDLKWLKQQGLDKAIEQAVANQKFIVGLCGGFQMLGNNIEDSQNVESPTAKVEGLKLLELNTLFNPYKISRQTTAKFLANSKFELLQGLTVRGYEIHNGISSSTKSSCFTSGTDDCLLGLTKGNILGTYLHGIFDNDEFRKNFLNIVRAHKGLKALNRSYSFEQFKESQYEQLADLIEGNLDANQILSLISNEELVIQKQVLRGASS